MTDADGRYADEPSLFFLGTALVRNWRRILRWMFYGAFIVALVVAWRPQLYLSSASFVPQSSNGTGSGLASLAGQFGVALPGADRSQSPEFYSSLLESSTLLRAIVRDTLVVPELEGKGVPVLDLFKIPREPADRREDLGIRKLSGIVKTSVTRTTGVVHVSVATRWPSVSFALVTALVNGVNEFNQRSRQGQAAAERKFLEGRLAAVGVDLRSAEDRMEQFLKTNRDFSGSPQLMFERDRLQRDLALQQQVYTSLTQSYEDARMREVRDTPVVTVVDSPSLPVLPEPRGRMRMVLLAFFVTGFLGATVVSAFETVAHRRAQGDREAVEFARAVGELKNGMLGLASRFGRRIRRQ